jgi:hypothetical protein
VAAASPEGLVVDVGAAEPLGASYADEEPPPRVPPAGWAAKIDLAAAARPPPPQPQPSRRRSGGDVVDVDLFDDDAPDAAARKERMEKFQQMREKKKRDMDERRRLEREHHAALRAGGFAHNVDATKPAPPLKAGPPPVGRGRLCNAKTLANALQQICLAGPHCADRLAAALARLKASPADHHVVVLKDDNMFRGVYAVGRGGACEKIHGRGPARFAEADVATFLKFNSARRAFVKLPSRSFSLTTDAVMLSASVLPKNRPALY